MIWEVDDEEEEEDEHAPEINREKRLREEKNILGGGVNVVDQGVIGTTDN